MPRIRIHGLDEKSKFAWFVRQALNNLTAPPVHVTPRVLRFVKEIPDGHQLFETEQLVKELRKEGNVELAQQLARLKIRYFLLPPENCQIIAV